MAKNNDYTIFAIIALVLVLIIGGQNGWFKSITNINQLPNANPGSTPNQINSCTDSDGNNKDNLGYVTYGGNTYTDVCLNVGQAVTEYTCNSYGNVASQNIACDLGEICSGGYCKTSTPTWHAGDTVFSGTGTGTLTSTNEFASLDLSEYGITTGGNCQLGAQIQTSWSYANPADCAGVMGTTGVKWDFYDSSGLEYSRLDVAPVALGVDLNPSNGHTLNWDGVTPWKGMVSKVPNIMPQCLINYEYSARIYIWSCS